jgi:Tfp pilus assembly protein PilV
MKRTKRRRLGERGASLIEAVVAVLIFSTVVVGFARTTMSSRRTGDWSRFEAEATTLAMDKLEYLRTRPATDAELTSGAHVDATNPLRPDGTSGGVYTRTWQITQNVPIVGMSRIEMRVAWPSQIGGRSVLLVSTFPVT